MTPSGRQLTARAVFAAAMRIRPVSPATGSGSKGTVQKEITDLQEIEDIIYVLDGDGRTTKKESINDYPVGIKEPIKVELKSDNKKDSIAVIYIYEDNSLYYLEQPYNGIYQMSGDEYNGIVKYLR